MFLVKKLSQFLVVNGPITLLAKNQQIISKNEPLGPLIFFADFVVIDWEFRPPPFFGRGGGGDGCNFHN